VGAAAAAGCGGGGGQQADSDTVISLGMGSAAAAAGEGGDDDVGDGDGGKIICQVPGCGREVAGLKDYHQRYRICALHIKLPQVMVTSPPPPADSGRT
jgi:hypothetical protein